jgi:hypothetical protein
MTQVDNSNDTDDINQDDRYDILNQFLEKSGYGFPEVLSLSHEDNTFLMRNGGKYRMVDGEIEHLAGPSPDPNERL